MKRKSVGNISFFTGLKILIFPQTSSLDVLRMAGYHLSTSFNHKLVKYELEIAQIPTVGEDPPIPILNIVLLYFFEQLLGGGNSSLCPIAFTSSTIYS